MSLRQVFSIGPLFLLVTVSTGVFAANPPGDTEYDTLVRLLAEFRQMTGSDAHEIDLIPDMLAAAVAEQAAELAVYQRRLQQIDWKDWGISRQIDYHLVRAEMNGLEFQHRVTRPWFRDPGMYSDVIKGLSSDMIASQDMGGSLVGMFPLSADDVKSVATRLKAIPGLVKLAKINLADTSIVPGDLAVLAIRDLQHSQKSVTELINDLRLHHPKLVGDAEDVQRAIGDYLNWLEGHQEDMTALAGVGKDNYNWLLKNVYLFPYTWDELRTLVELEDNRVITFRRLEENRNRRVPMLEPVQSQAEYKASVQESIDYLMNFIREEEIFSIPDYLTPDGYFGSWHGFDKPWPDKHDYFFNFSHRESLMEETHEMVGHHFDQLRAQFDTDPIRGGWRPYKISTARTEGFAFALEELLMHAGYLDSRSPRAREVAYEQSAFRTVRAMSDIYMHSNDWSLADSMQYCVANAPHGELLDDSEHLWFEMATTLRGVGHHMLMVVGKIQFMKLLRDRSQQQGDQFELKSFMDEFFESGLIPFSLIRWEMTGETDEIEKLW